MESDDLQMLMVAKEDLDTARKLAPSNPQVFFYVGSILHRTALVIQSMRMAQGVQGVPVVESMQFMAQAKEAFEEACKKHPDCCEGLVLYSLVRCG